MKRIFLAVAFLLMFSQILFADTSTSTSTLSITPSATSGTTITASDENDRNSDVSTWANAHVHSLSNTTNFGDGAAGDKTLCADAADTTDSCIRWDDTNNQWVINTFGLSSFNAILVSSGTSGLTNNAFLLGAGAAGAITAASMTAGSTLPATFGDFSARARNSAAISLTSGTATVLTYDSERWDTDTIHSTSSNTGRLTATTAGKYQISGHIEFAAATNPSANGQRLLEVLLNGATVIAAQDCGFAGPDPSRAVPCSISTHYNLSAADYVELRVTQRVQTTLNINASGNYSPEFEMVKVP